VAFTALYLLYSRYAVGWMLASRENADLAMRFIRETIEKENVDADELTIHSDRGPAMLVKKDTIYVRTLRTNGTVSSAQITRRDWPDLIDTFVRPGGGQGLLAASLQKVGHTAGDDLSLP